MISIDKFGRTLKRKNISDGPVFNKRHSLALTDKGDYDIQGRKLCNISTPDEKHDCATKIYVDNGIKGSEIQMEKKVNDIDIKNEKLIANHIAVFATETAKRFAEVHKKLKYLDQLIIHVRATHDVKIEDLYKKNDKNINSLQNVTNLTDQTQTITTELLAINQKIEDLKKKLI